MFRVIRDFCIRRKCVLRADRHRECRVRRRAIVVMRRTISIHRASAIASPPAFAPRTILAVTVPPYCEPFLPQGDRPKSIARLTAMPAKR